jgi:hypothetical protein
VHLLADPFADRVLAFGVLHPATEAGAVQIVLPAAVGDEWRALMELVAALPQRVPLLHFGEALPRWHEAHAFDREADPALEARFVDLQKRLRGAALYPRPVFGLADFVRAALGRDPERCGNASAAALWLTGPDGEARLRQKLTADLHDLAALKHRILDAEPTAAEDAAADAAAAEA